MSKKIKHKKKSVLLMKGFSLVELMVTLTIFSAIMVISLGSILSVLDGNRKSQSLRSVMDNMNYTLESMTRTMRFGHTYHSWGCSAPVDISLPHDCSVGDSSLTVTDVVGHLISYRLEGGRIIRSDDTDPDEWPITSPDVTIDKLMFYVSGSKPYGDGLGFDADQPKIVMVVGGYAGSKPSSQSSFTLQTTVSQRLFDFE